jgi:hypothetical protein
VNPDPVTDGVLDVKEGQPRRLCCRHLLGSTAAVLRVGRKVPHTHTHTQKKRAQGGVQKKIRLKGECRKIRWRVETKQLPANN